MDYPTIQVQSFYPGASPDVMTTSVTAILERQFGQMPGLKEMSSVSSGGFLGHHPAIRPQPQPGHRRTGSAGGDQCRRQPVAPTAGAAGLCQGQSRRRAGADAGDQFSQPANHTVEDLADTRIAQKISQLAGVGLVSISGGHRPAVRVQANLQPLASYGLNIDDLRTTIANANSNAPKGQFDGAAAVLHHQRQRPAAKRRRLRQYRRGL